MSDHDGLAQVITMPWRAHSIECAGGHRHRIATDGIDAAACERSLRQPRAARDVAILDGEFLREAVRAHLFDGGRRSSRSPIRRARRGGRTPRIRLHRPQWMAASWSLTTDRRRWPGQQGRITVGVRVETYSQASADNSHASPTKAETTATAPPRQVLLP